MSARPPPIRLTVIGTSGSTHGVNASPTPVKNRATRTQRPPLKSVDSSRLPDSGNTRPDPGTAPAPASGCDVDATAEGAATAAGLAAVFGADFPSTSVAPAADRSRTRRKGPTWRHDASLHACHETASAIRAPASAEYPSLTAYESAKGSRAGTDACGSDHDTPS